MVRRELWSKAGGVQRVRYLPLRAFPHLPESSQYHITGNEGAGARGGEGRHGSRIAPTMTRERPSQFAGACVAAFLRVRGQSPARPEKRPQEAKKRIILCRLDYISYLCIVLQSAAYKFTLTLLKRGFANMYALAFCKLRSNAKVRCVKASSVP